MSFAWVFATLFAAGFQVARNGLQRSLLGSTGPWGATLVRFLFGLPFSLVMAGVAAAVTQGAAPHLSPAYLGICALGAISQILATASLLAAMRRVGFGVSTALQQSSLPLAALIGLAAFGDRLSPTGWLGVAITTVGLAVLTWPRKVAQTGGTAIRQPWFGAAFGLFSGLMFGFSLNAFRHAGLALEPHHPIYSAVLTVPLVQALQSVVLGLPLLLLDPAEVKRVVGSWRASLLTGVCGALCSVGWFVALALAPAASVRAVGVVEAPMAALAGHRLFKEHLHWTQLAAGAAVALGVVLTALG